MIAIPFGAAQTFHYEAYGRVNSSRHAAVGHPGGLHLRRRRAPATRTDPSGLTTTRGYDTPYTGRLTSETVTGDAQTPSFAYTYDPVGNVLTSAQTLPGNADSGTWTYAYDAMNRLKTAQLGANPQTTYEFDGAGNRTKVGTVTTSYDSAGLPTSSSDGTTFTFDAAGNMTSISGSRNW